MRFHVAFICFLFQHLKWRVICRKWLVWFQPVVRWLFLATLEDVCRQTGWVVHAYVLMSNHYHLLLETPEANLVAGMKWFQGTYTQRFNARFKRWGHLFQGRYKALPVESGGETGYFREVGQYIHLNPFRAGLAGTGNPEPLEGYRWSSYPYYVGGSRKPPDWLCRDRLLGCFDLEVGQRGYRQRYQALTESRMQGEVDPLAEATSNLVKKQLKRGWFIGSDSFRDQLIDMIPGRTDNLRGAQRRAHDEKAAEELLKTVLDTLGISENKLRAMKSTQIEKQAIAWLLKKRTTVTVVWIAERLRMGHRTNASRAISSFDREPEKLAAKQGMIQFTG